MSSESRRDEKDVAPLGVRPLVGLALLEAVRDSDLPSETFEDEDLAYTMPRRFGVNRVMSVQIRQYQEAVRRRQRMSDDELVSLVRLVTRRPDSEEIFRLAGERLGGEGGSGPGWYRIVPERLRRRRAARNVRRRIRNLFGRPFGPVAATPLTLESDLDLLVRGDPGGEACLLMGELLRTIAERHLTQAAEVLHVECQVRGGPRCRWEVVSDAEAKDGLRSGNDGWEGKSHGGFGR